jgi:hypothetical protein
MTLDFKKARELCTEPEFALVVATRATSLRSLTPRLVRLKVARARGLRDKFRDVAFRQAREAKGKVAPRRRRPARGNAGTVEKAQLFEEVLRRFERRAAELDQQLDQPVKSGAASRGARATAKASKAGATTAKATKADASAPTTKADATAKATKADAKAPAATAPARSKAPARTRARATRAARPSPQRRARSEATAGIRKGKKLAISYVPREQAHVSSRNRRGQARRDSR